MDVNHWSKIIVTIGNHLQTMKKLIILLLLLPVNILAVNIDNHYEIHKTNRITYWAEDNRNYNELIRITEEYNSKLESLFGSIIDHINIYIYEDYESFNNKVYWSSDKSVIINGIANPDSNEIYLISHYDDCRPKEILLNTISHELVHLYYNHYCIWINEGIAHYFSDMLAIIDTDKLPESTDDLKFWENTEQSRREAYHFSAWIIKYIYEEICQTEVSLLVQKLEEYKSGIFFDYENETTFFADWQEYMLKNNYVKITG